MEKKTGLGSAGDHLANERTFLAWIRTAIATMAFGFVVVKFSLFVKQIALAFSDKGVVVPTKGVSGWLGLFFVGIGAVMTILAFLRYRTIARQLNEGRFRSSDTVLIWLTIITVAASLMLVAYLVESVAQ